MKKRVFCKDCKYYAPTDPLYFAYYTAGMHYPADCSESHGIKAYTAIEPITLGSCSVKNANNDCKYFKKRRLKDDNNGRDV